VLGAVLGSVLSVLWVNRMLPVLFPRMRALLRLLGDQAVLCVSLLLSGLAVAAMGPMDRRWKDSFIKPDCNPTQPTNNPDNKTKHPNNKASKTD